MVQLTRRAGPTLCFILLALILQTSGKEAQASSCLAVVLSPCLLRLPGHKIHVQKSRPRLEGATKVVRGRQSLAGLANNVAGVDYKSSHLSLTASHGWITPGVGASLGVPPGAAQYLGCVSADPSAGNSTSFVITSELAVTLGHVKTAKECYNMALRTREFQLFGITDQTVCRAGNANGGITSSRQEQERAPGSCHSCGDGGSLFGGAPQLCGDHNGVALYSISWGEVWGEVWGTVVADRVTFLCRPKLSPH